MGRSMKTKICLSFLFLCFCGVSFAQSLRYVTYFPIPFGHHASLKVKDIALLASTGDGSVIVGSSSFKTGGMVIGDSFEADNLKIKIDADADTSVSATTLVVGSIVSAPTSTVYNGVLQSSSDISVVSSDLATPSFLEANAQARVKGLYWNSYGGFGEGGSGWPSDSGCSDFSWKSLKLDGTDFYKTYLVCSSDSSGCDGYLRPGTSESCGNCGSRTRSAATCSNGSWSAETWGKCVGEGSCTPGTVESLGGRQERRCSVSCGWEKPYCKYSNEELEEGKCVPKK